MNLIVMLACSGDPSDTSQADTTDTTDTTNTTDTAETIADTDSTVDVPDETYGQAPATSLPAPAFSATNYDGTSRGIDDLTDGPTVVWFFPAAGTYG